MARKRRVKRAVKKASGILGGQSARNIATGALARVAVNQFVPKVIPFGLQNPAEQALIGTLVKGQKHFLKVATADATAILVRRFLMPRLMGMAGLNGQGTVIGAVTGITQEALNQ